MARTRAFGGALQRLTLQGQVRSSDWLSMTRFLPLCPMIQYDSRLTQSSLPSHAPDSRSDYLPYCPVLHVSPVETSRSSYFWTRPTDSEYSSD
ncbi:hypothetical protein [Sporisorium scitamineum]|uniref:Uncharacterized protein n=1 Tax=Sporisorium scitamineum TaxID=49012 RepID=A0A0F7RYE7_9BASI|nr:hypothetical protein [Sporisorium scitamineum]